MEALEEVVVGELRDPSHQIVKGKRTKRQRPSSPIPFIIVSGHLSSGEGGEYSSNEETTTTTYNNNISNNDDYNNNNNNNDSTNNLRLSLAGYWDGDNSTTTEDEEAARLLILLSQGNSRESSTKNDYLDHKYYPQSPKFTSKKYIETSSNANGKSGMFVYECKTCNRTFPSFQALGGHRASHSKPKNLAIEGIKKRPLSSVFIDDYDYDFYPSQPSFARNNYHSNLTSSMSHNSLMNKSTTSPRIHECSYCGAEFTSGQALGGHMRRHRGSNGNNNSNYKYYYNNNINNNSNHNNINNIQPLLTLSPSLTSVFSANQDSVGIKKQKIDNDDKDALSLSLSLDLNLPAPQQAENDQKIQESSENEFVAEKISPSPPEKKQQTDNKESALVLFTTPTLVDCHY
ncbi:hypothetical protein Leryth_020275 [Lithospermum erythrorhizon]|uniref:C2H2-type domain-containing protein n=1 Tax=Lithospermum erythrorhizon TaxID=34254 RepID=A0AAV3S3D0_LITER|nr:hypothetical protein Leryth_020275 [Lithospermum erythrorhizon]